MLKTTLGQLMINESLPEDMRDYNRTLDKKGVKTLMRELAERHPDQYREVAKRISDVGRDAAFTTGGNSFGLKALRRSPVALVAEQRIRAKIDKILDSDASDDDINKQVIELLQDEHPKLIKAIQEESIQSKNPLAEQLMGAGRGKPVNLASLRGFDGLYADNNGNPIPIPVLRSYGQGLHPAEYFAGAFGARKGISDVQMATADAGFLAKQLNQMMHRLVVTGDDPDDDVDDPTAPIRGLPVSTDDSDNEGALLARAVGNYPRNTLLTPKILADLRDQGIDDILVRSPMVGGPRDGGVSPRDVGMRERGIMAPRGDFVGLAAAQALSEGVTQGALSSKHSGGVASDKGTVGGFKTVDRMIQVPKSGGWAAHAQDDGKVSSIVPAPQGGQYVVVAGQQHYVPPGVELKVQVGDDIEAGDVLSAGLPNPSEIVRHKGIGEGRRYFTKTFKDVMIATGPGAHRRNIELMARGLINHVRLTDEVGDYVPDDVVPYSVLERTYQPREDAQLTKPEQAVGRYLERPVLHYSVGTRVRPSMLKEMGKFGVQQIHAHRDPPPFQPEMVRGMYNVANDPDWMTRMLGSGQKKSLLTAAQRGATSDTEGTSYVPALAGSTDFGRTGLTQGWKS